MELDNTIETKDDTAQPDEVVVTDSEATETKPQVEATEGEEFYVDDSSGDQDSHKNEMTQAQAYAAFQKKKKQSAQRKEALEAGQVREQKLQSELDELKATVGKMVKGKPPTLEQFDFDESQYESAMQSYYATPSDQPASKPEQDGASNNPINDEAEFYLYQSEQALTKAIPGYDDAKAAVAESFVNAGIPSSDAAFNYISKLAKYKGVDAAKVVFAMSKSPQILRDIVAAGANDFAIADIIAEAESKVKTRSKKAIDSKPEPSITNSGPIDSTNEAAAKLRAAWIDNPSTANYNAYQQAKKKKVN